jgi:hypothetical protein
VTPTPAGRGLKYGAGTSSPVFDVPIDGWYAWLGVAATSAAALGAVAGLPTAPPPDAAGLAGTIDRTAATEHGATASHPVEAERIRVEPRGVGLANDAGRTHATFAYGPVTPVGDDSRLRRVLAGAPPTRVFDSPAALRRAAGRARDRPTRWRRIDGPVRIRHVVVEGEDVVLVGA